jgi:hypothetical protein
MICNLQVQTYIGLSIFQSQDQSLDSNRLTVAYCTSPVTSSGLRINALNHSLMTPQPLTLKPAPSTTFRLACIKSIPDDPCQPL